MFLKQFIFVVLRALKYISWMFLSLSFKLQLIDDGEILTKHKIIKIHLKKCVM